MKNNKKKIILSSIFGAITIGVTIAGNLTIQKYSQVLKPFFGTSNRRMTNVNAEGVDKQYYKMSYTKDELQNELKEYSDDIAEEGIVLLEKGNIPYENNTNVTLFSKSSVDFVFGGTGSGVANSSLTLKSSLESSGFKVNNKLWDFYKSGTGKNYSRGIGSINYGDSDDFSINEVPLSVIKRDSSVINSLDFNSVGIFVLSRTGGEGNDLARGMINYVDTRLDKNSGQHPNATDDKYKSYLEPDSIELEIMQYINDNFRDFILIVNCNNAMELDFAKRFNKLKTIVQIPASGENGLNALGKILRGEIASSGRLADTFVVDSFKIPSSQNIGDFEYLINGSRMPNINKWSGFDGLFYMHYDESIYVGYKYFETRYADLMLNNNSKAGTGDWKYEDNVIYPFGYGDSIANFSYSNFAVTENTDSFDLSIDITNTGNISAREVVQFYVQTPYGDFEKENLIEKSAIELVEFEKTELLPVGETQTVTINVKKENLTSYMSKNGGKYVLSGGDYYFTAGKDAHAAINNILKFQNINNLVPSPSEEIAGNKNLVKKFTLSKDDTTYKAEASNQFDFVDARTYDPSHKYLSRSNYETTYPQINGEISNIASIHSERVATGPNGKTGSFEYTANLSKESKIYKDVLNFENLAPTRNYTSKDVEWEKKSVYDFIDLRGLDITDPRYDEVVKKMKMSEALNMFSFAGYTTSSAKSINKPETFDTDGPAGFNTVSGHKSIGYSYPCSLIIAQTWNKKLMHKTGELLGEESILYEVQGLYGPTANIHRSPFGGRNFEYFSEDTLLTGIAAREEIHGAATRGLVGYLKHFALNDQETHREKENGVCIFANEQTIRETYLRAFEIAIKDNFVEETYYDIKTDNEGNLIKENGKNVFEEKTAKVPACRALMTSFSRLGGVWAGACYPLLNNVLIDEWDYKGILLTDYYHGWFMNKGQSLLGGGNLILDPQGNTYEISKNDYNSQYVLQHAMKHVLYAVVNSNTANGYIHGTKELLTWNNYWYIQIGVNVLLATALTFCIINLVKGIKGIKKQKEDNQ